MRGSRWHRALIALCFVLAFFLPERAHGSVYQYSVHEGGRTVYLWVPPSCHTIRGLLVAFRNLSEPLWLEDPLIRTTAAGQCIGIVWIGHGENSALDANMGPGAGEAFLAMQHDLATVSGFPEIANAPIIATGHSAQGQFAWRFAEWAPERTIAAIPIKTIPLPKDLSLGEVPLLYAVGETTEWPQYRDGSKPGDRDFFWPVVQASATHVRAQAPESRLAVVTDPGGGHFDWSPALARAVATFIRRACELRLPAAQPSASTRPVLKNLPFAEGWLMDARGLQPERFPSAPYAQYRGPKDEAYWVFDKQTATAISSATGDRIVRKHQMLSFEQNGIISQVTRGFASLVFPPDSDGVTLTLHPVFLDSIPPELVDAGKPLGHSRGPIHLRVICGPIRQLGPQRFELAFDRDDNTHEAWIEEEQDGDARYRKAVQPAKLLLPDRSKGSRQTIVFPPIEDHAASEGEIQLRATATSGLPVHFFVVAGPAEVDGDRMRFSEVPLGGAGSIEVTVVAYQWGSNGAGAFAAATPVTQSFHIIRDAKHR